MIASLILTNAIIVAVLEAIKVIHFGKAWISKMRPLLLISIPFVLVWFLGLLTFPVIFGWQIATYVNTGLFPAADISSLASTVDQIVPVTYFTNIFLEY